MKTIEEKAKAHDKALTKARMYRDNAKAAGDYAAVARYENIFPELSKSEDDELIEIIKGEFEGFRRLLKRKGIDYEPQRSYWEGFARLFKSSAKEYVKEQKPIKVYRVENEDKQKGLWRKFDGTWEPLFDMLTDGLCRNLPMEDSDLYRAEGKKWFASAPSRETLQKWFSKRDLEELTAAGFTISEFEVTNYKKVSEFEYIFTRDSIINRTYLTVSDIYPEQRPAEWSEEDKLTIDAAIYWLMRRLKIESAFDISTEYSPLSMRKTAERLKSFHLPSKSSWKPTPEQIELLEKLSNHGSHYGYQNLELQKLVTQLRKL